ncbi:MAG: hypothetical protein R3F14_29630 [Polyangiaceae bacterium]
MKPQHAAKTLIIVLGVLALIGLVTLGASSTSSRSAAAARAASCRSASTTTVTFVPPPTATATTTTPPKVWGPRPQAQVTRADDIYDEP